MDQPGKVTNPARGQLNRENNIPLSPCVPENLVSRDGFSRPVPRQPAHLHTQAESGAYLRDLDARKVSSGFTYFFIKAIVVQQGCTGQTQAIYDHSYRSLGGSLQAMMRV